MSDPTRYGSGCSPCPIWMPPESVPWLLWIRLLAISRLCAQPWTKMPPPPCELLVIDRPSIRAGLQLKLLVSVLQLKPFALLSVSSVVPSGNVSAPNGFELLGKRTPFESTVMAAP